MKRLLATLACLAITGFSAHRALGQAAAQGDPQPNVQVTPQPAPRAHTLTMTRHAAGYLGVGGADIDEDRARVLKLKDAHGVEIKSLEDDSPAAKAGLKEGDVVLEYNGQRIEGMEQFIRLVRETPVNRKVTLLISRNGANQTVTATLAARTAQVFSNNFNIEIPEAPLAPLAPFAPLPPMAPQFRIPDTPRAVLSWQNGSIGIEAESLNSQLADYFGVKSGVLVRAVSKNSLAEKSGLKAGDVVMRVNGVDIATPHEISAQLRSARNKPTASFAVMRNHREITIEVKSGDAWQIERDDR